MLRSIIVTNIRAQVCHSSLFLQTTCTMRLLYLESLGFEEFHGDGIPPYGILSHRWGTQEISYKDVLKGRNLEGPGYDKILGFCELARHRNGRVWDEARLEVKDVSMEWGWIDTCCIDKRSSAELTEAINLMFNWYHRAAICYVHLADVSAEPHAQKQATFHKTFTQSNWFTRGWTLQDLLAPWARRVLRHRLGDSGSQMCPPRRRTPASE